MNQPYYIKILWGEEPDSVDDDDFQEYAFETLAELKAFVFGVKEAMGFGDFAIVDPQNTLNYADSYGSEGDYRRDVGRELEEDGSITSC